MPWPMVHFAIASNLFEGEPSPDFLLGSISPDAIHVRGDISREEKGTTHLVSNGKMPNEEMILHNCKVYFSMWPEMEWKDFVLGYFSHIYADLRWTDTLYAEFERAYEGNQEHIRNTYTVEVSQLEFLLMKSMENTEEILTRLKIAKGFSIEPFVTRQEVEQYRDQKISWLRDEQNEPCITSIYFPIEKVQRFIDQTSFELKELYIDWRDRV